MRSIIILLFLSFAYGEILKAGLQRDISLNDNRKITKVYEYLNRDIRSILFSKKSKSFDVQASKTIYKNENNKISAIGGFNGNTGKIEAGVNYANINGNNLSLTAQRDSTGKKIIANGNVNLLKTDKHVIRTGGFVAKDIFAKSGHGGTKYNGTLEYIMNNTLSAGLSAQHDSKTGKKMSADVNYNIYESDKNKFSANGFFARHARPNNTAHHNFGGSLDFSHRNKFDANLNITHSGSSKRTGMIVSGNAKGLGGLKFETGVFKSANGSIKPIFKFSLGEED